MASSLIKQLGELVESIDTRTAAILNEGVRNGNGVLTNEQRQELDNLGEARKDAAERLRNAEQGEQRARDLDESFRREHGDPEERGGADSEFAKWVRESRAGEKYDVAIESRAMSGTGGTGKAGVSTQLWEHAIESSEILKYATLMTTADGNTIPMPRATIHAEPDDADIPANGPITESDSTLDTVDLGVAKRGYITYVPNELLQDATFDVEGYISRNAGRQLGLNVAAAGAAAAKAGFTVPGVTTLAGDTASLGDQSAIGHGSDYLVDLFYSVIAPYRASLKCAFGMSDGAAAVVRKLKTADGKPVWESALVAGQPDLILGKPVFVEPNFDPFGVSKKPIFFGDWSALVVRIAGGLRFERSAEAGFGNDQTAFRALVRRGAVGLDPTAVKPLVTAGA
ncbi:phage major capsid protein [Isoptericola variabilis]|uniref:phage major capsid protein n=1 Tax=Isoptericola variabilis TaxID=139208 RepID=UPI003D20224C